jgi:chromosome segregation ATPase
MVRQPSLERRVQVLERKMSKLEDLPARIDAALARFAKELDAKLEKRLEVRFKEEGEMMDERFAQVYAYMDRRFAAVDARFDAVDARSRAVDGRLDTIDGRLDTIDGRLDKIDGELRILREGMKILLERTAY